jgi:CHAT domain-containing protein
MVFPATKTNVKRALDGVDWAHMACHADLETDALVLADLLIGGSDLTHSADLLREIKPKASDLSMDKVQGREGVKLAQGATVVLSACNTGRGEIKAEEVVGLARGFRLANASAAVVSLWSADDGSTAALMRIKYEHFAEGCTVPQALRLAMLRLASRPDRLAVPHKEAPEACESRAEDVTDG